MTRAIPYSPRTVPFWSGPEQAYGFALGRLGAIAHYTDCGRRNFMRVAYLTTDEVNEQLAQEMAIRCGITLCSVAPKDPPPDGEYDAILYDRDSLPIARQREVMAELRAGPLPHAVALHGYNLEEVMAAALNRNTLAVYRH